MTYEVMSVKDTAKVKIEENFKANQVSTMILVLERKKTLERELAQVEKDILEIESATEDYQLLKLRGVLSARPNY